MGRPKGSKNSVERKYKDYSGSRIGLLSVLRKTGEDRFGSVYECLCDCGKITYRSVGNLKNAKSCGCYRINMISSDRAEKVCSKCREAKPIDCFSKNKSRKDGHSQFCKECISELDRHYRPVQREYRNEYQRNKRNTDINFRIADNLRRRINSAIRGGHKKSGSLALIGCSVSELIGRLESEFHSGMSWENYGEHWEIDHIKPCASFDLSVHEEQLACFNHSNLQPLLAFDNRKKSSWYNGVKYTYG